MTTDMRIPTQPKSDQLNSDSLIGAPITIKITKVVIKPGEQPVSVFYDGDDGKPWKPCKSMGRVMMQGWKNNDASTYVGKSLTLYRDADVTWGGLKVGGIRISHMSHIDSPMTFILTAKKGDNKPFKVLPLKTAPTPKSDPEPFDFPAFETRVTTELAASTDAENLTEWWAAQKPERMRAGTMDKDRAIKVAEMVQAKISELSA